MLNPYYQVFLERTDPVRSPATYTYKFRTPQRLGIFKFVIDHWRYGMSYLEEEQEVSVI
jgi:hypothetical protein